jgi:hypothetical protein
MNDHVRIIALERRGYSRRQAQFLCQVLLHSGCFLRRQYSTFSGIEDGACTTDFVQDLVRRRLATCERFDRDAQLIRLSSGLLYDAIGEPHSRLQRAADPALIIRASRICQRRFGQAVVHEPDAATRERVLAYFAARRRFELRQFRSFTEPEREQLRRDLERYKGNSYERWYAQWCVDGAPLPPAPPADRTSSDAPFSVQFVPVLLADRYPFVAPVREAA